MSDAVAAEARPKIRAETSVADPDTCKFLCDRPLHPRGPFVFESVEQAAGSPLPERIFALGGVTHVLISGSVLTVSKTPDARWDDLRRAIGAEIRAQWRTGAPAVLEASYDPTTGRRSDEEVRTVIERLLDREVNPSIATHGGKISLVDFSNSTLSVQMSGGCQGCAASSATLRANVEVMVHRLVPEVVDIVDTTDHSAGKMPFYKF